MTYVEGGAQRGLDMLLPRCLLLAFLLRLCSGKTSQATSGPYAVLFETDKANRPTITVRLEDHVVWSTSTETDPISVAQIKQQVKQHGGDYIISTTVLQECNGLAYDGLKVYGNSPNYLIEITGQICNEANFTISFQAIPILEFVHLQLNITFSSSRYNQLTLTYACEADEGFYGFGAQYTRLNAKENVLPLFLSEQGVGRGQQPLTFILDTISPGAGGTWYTTYTRIPFYITNHMRSLAVESLDYLVYNMTSPNMVMLKVNSSSFVARIISGKSPLELIQSYTAFSGRMAPLPNWIGEGAILGLQGGTASVKESLQEIEQAAGNLNDIVGVWLQDWTGQRNFTEKGGDLPRVGLWWNWEVDQNHYPDWQRFINSLYSNGIKVLTYINPLVTDITKRGTPYQHNYYQEGIDNGYFIKQGDGSVWIGYSNASMIDLSNPKAYQWVMNMIVENMVATNVTGWMCDFGESVPLDALLDGEEDPNHYHSLYPSVWGQLNAEAIATAVNKGNITDDQAKDIVYFMRSGNVHSPSVTPLFWLGDQTVTWDSHDGLGSAIIGMLSSGMSGYSLSHSDIGGYTSLHVSIIRYLRSKDLFMRWSELSAFTVTFRTHLGTLPDQNWQYNSDKETLMHFLRMIRVFKAWGFYRTALIKEANEKGWPVVRHMMLMFPNNTKMYTEDLRYQYMLGSELLVAPVYSKSQHSQQLVNVFLPTGSVWIHVWSNKTYTGNDNWVEMNVPVGSPCVLYPQGSLVGQLFVKNLKSLLVIA